MVEYVFGEHVFLTIDPKEREGFLGAIQDLREEAQFIVLVTLLTVENLVSFRKLNPVLLGHRHYRQYFIESLDANEEIAARRGPLICVKFEFPQTINFILSFNQVFAHQHRLLKRLIAEASLEIFDLLRPLLM